MSFSAPNQSGQSASPFDQRISALMGGLGLGGNAMQPHGIANSYTGAPAHLMGAAPGGAAMMGQGGVPSGATSPTSGITAPPFGHPMGSPPPGGAAPMSGLPPTNGALGSPQQGLWTTPPPTAPINPQMPANVPYGFAR